MESLTTFSSSRASRIIHGHSQREYGAARRWLKLICGVGIAALLGLAAVTGGCGSQESEEPSPGATSLGVKLQATTAPGTGALDHITWNLPMGEPTTLDPAKAGDHSPCLMVSQLNDPLVRYTPDWELVPGIAESWEYVDPLTLVFKIRQNARFWNGNPVTAADVAFSLQRHKNPETGSLWSVLYVNVDSITQTGPWEVTVKLSQPDELFLKELGTNCGSIVEKAFVEDVGEANYGSGMNVMGSGPYKLVAWKPGSEMVLEANSDHWDPNLQPKVQKVTVKFITETSAVVNGLLSGELDGAYEVPPTAIPALESASSGKLYFGPSLLISELLISNPDGPLGNPEIRRALSMAIDRAAIAERVFNGAAMPNKTLTPPAAWDPEALSVYEEAYESIPGDTPDVAAAKELLSSQPDASEPVVLTYIAGDQRGSQVASIVQQAGRDIGLTIELRPMSAMDVSNFWYVPSYREGIDMGFTSGWLDIPDPLDNLFLFFGGDALFNYIGYSNREVEEKLDQARQTYDPIERATLIVEAQEIFTNDTVVIPLTSNAEILFMNNRISGAPVSWPFMWLPSLAMIGGTE